MTLSNPKFNILTHVYFLVSNSEFSCYLHFSIHLCLLNDAYKASSCSWYFFFWCQHNCISFELQANVWILNVFSKNLFRFDKGENVCRIISQNFIKNKIGSRNSFITENWSTLTSTEGQVDSTVDQTVVRSSASFN